jgi:hypothetical protein
MAYVVADPEMMTAAASDLAGIGSNLNAAHMVAAARTNSVIPAAADEVSASIAHLFSQQAANYQALAAQAAAFHDQFAHNLATGAFSYASIENAITSFLQNVGRNVAEAIFSFTEIPLVQNILFGIGAAVIVTALVALLVAVYVQTAWSVFIATGQILTPGAFLSDLISAFDNAYANAFRMGFA